MYTKRGISLLLFLLLSSTTLAAEIKDGEYWGLPNDYPVKSPYGGIGELWDPEVRPFNELTDMFGISGHRWSTLNPAEDEYNWDLLENGNSGVYGLKELRDNDKPGFLFIHISEKARDDSWNSVPEWVIQKCEDASTPVSEITSASQSWMKKIMATWEPCPRAELVKFIREFNRYKDDPALAYAWMTTFQYGEFHLDSMQLTEAKAKGFTPKMLEDFCKEYIDAWDYAMGQDKLVWMSFYPGRIFTGFRVATNG